MTPEDHPAREEYPVFIALRSVLRCEDTTPKRQRPGGSEENDIPHIPDGKYNNEDGSDNLANAKY